MTQNSDRQSGSVVTIQEVARHAGVSPATASRVVYGEPELHEVTRARVQASIRALGYSPNLTARSPASAEGIRIGLLHVNPSAAYLSAFLTGILEQSRLTGCQLLIETCDAPGSAREAILKISRAGAEGVILPAPLCESAEALAAVEEVGLAAVVAAAGRPPRALSAVGIDDYEAAWTMTLHLIRLGHRRIAFIKGPPSQTAGVRRYEGYERAMLDAELDVEPDQVAQGDFTYRSGLDAAERLLTGGRRPTAIFASNDDMAAAAMAVAHRQGLDVPGELSIAGFDDTALATAVWPALTTVRQPIADMAQAAGALLLEQIRARRSGALRPPVHRRLDFALVARESCGPAPSR